MNISIVLLCLVLIIAYMLTYHTIPLRVPVVDITHVCGDGKIAVVGNGKLSIRDRQEIEECACVIRFNDMKNRKMGERVDVLAIRHNIKDVKFNGVVWPVFKYCDEDFLQYVHSIAHMIITPIAVFEDTCTKYKTQWKNKGFFTGCHKTVKQGSARCGPSTGGVVIEHLFSHPKIAPENINIYGMNWNGGDWHLDFNDPFLIQECCKNCKIHQTNTNKYNSNT